MIEYPRLYLLSITTEDSFYASYLKNFSEGKLPPRTSVDGEWLYYSYDTNKYRINLYDDIELVRVKILKMMRRLGYSSPFERLTLRVGER